MVELRGKVLKAEATGGRAGTQMEELRQKVEELKAQLQQEVRWWFVCARFCTRVFATAPVQVVTQMNACCRPTRVLRWTQA